MNVYSPTNEAELLLIGSLLRSTGIPYYVLNDNFGSLYIGPRIKFYTDKSILVHIDDAADTLEVIKDYFHCLGTAPYANTHRFSHWDKLRNIVEYLLASWFVPRHLAGHIEEYPVASISKIGRTVMQRLAGRTNAENWLVTFCRVYILCRRSTAGRPDCKFCAKTTRQVTDLPQIRHLVDATGQHLVRL